LALPQAVMSRKDQAVHNGTPVCPNSRRLGSVQRIDAHERLGSLGAGSPCST
jgi:hypothetical protein